MITYLSIQRRERYDHIRPGPWKFVRPGRNSPPGSRYRLGDDRRYAREVLGRFARWGHLYDYRIVVVTEHDFKVLRVKR